MRTARRDNYPPNPVSAVYEYETIRLMDLVDELDHFQDFLIRPNRPNP
jgi:hypothetical protein